MKFICQKAILAESLGIASRAVSAKNAIPALEGILIDCTFEGLTLTSYNLEIGIITKCSANVEEEGKTCVNARLFSDIIRKFSGICQSICNSGSSGAMPHSQDGI